MENNNMKTDYQVEEDIRVRVIDNGTETHYIMNADMTGLIMTHLFKCPDSLTELTIPSSIEGEYDDYEVTAIGPYIFYSIDHRTCNIERVIIPFNIEFIAPEAFDKSPEKLQTIVISNPSLLEGVNLPKGVQVITESYETIDHRPEHDFEIIFDSDIHLYFKQNGLDSVGLCDYDYIYPLFDLGIPKKVVGNDDVAYNVTEISEFCFLCCRQIVSAVIPDTVKTICEEAFCNSSLAHVIIPDSVEAIADYAFSSTELTSFHLPKSVTFLGAPILDNCLKLKEITVDEDNPIYDSRNNCNAIVETATSTLVQGCSTTRIPDTVTGIGMAAFRGCNFEVITIPDSVKYIGEDAFSLCSKLKEIVISDATLLNNADVPKGVAIITPEEKKRAIGRILSTLGAK